MRKKAPRRIPANRDCSRLHNDLDCLERNAFKLCPSCKRYSRKEAMRDLQEDLNEVLDDLETVELGPRIHTDQPQQVNVSGIFCEFIAARIPKVGWLDNLSKIPLRSLHKVRYNADNYGLSEIAAIVGKYIALRKAA